MSEFFMSLLKGILSFSIATLVIVVEPSAYATDLSDETIQKELGLMPAKLDPKDLENPKVVTKEEKTGTKKGSAPTLASPGLTTVPPSKK